MTGKMLDLQRAFLAFDEQVTSPLPALLEERIRLHREA